MLRRYPRRIRNFLFVVDRHHQCNHKDCSMAYNMDKYKDLDNINSQISEQRNNSLRKLSNTLAFYKFDSYMKVLEIFFGLTNDAMTDQAVKFVSKVKISCPKLQKHVECTWVITF